VPLGMLFIMKTPEDERYVGIKAYKFTVHGILKDFFIVCPRHFYI